MLTLGELKAEHIIFDDKYVVGADKMDYLAFITKYPNHSRCEGLNLDGWEPKFFLVCNVDCYDPPKWIVRADNESDAEQRFITETDMCLISEPDLKDYKEDMLNWDDNGRPMDCDNVHISEVKITGLVQ